MKALLVLALSVAVSARPGPGFAYSVLDPGPGFQAPQTLENKVVAPQMVYTAVAANQVVAPYTIANQVVAPQTVYTTVANQVPNLVYNPVVYQVAACHNNDGQVVPCAGVDTTLQTVVSVEQRQMPVAIPQAPVAAAPAAVAPAPQVSASEQTGVISVKKREADPLHYFNGFNAFYGYPSQPLVYSQPVVYANPVIYNAKVGCRNDAGEVVACIGEPEPVAKAEAAPEAVSEARTVEIPEQTRLEAAAAAAKIVAVKKREAEPVYYHSSVVPYTTSPYVVNPIVYNQQTPMLYQASACYNAQGLAVPCAQGHSVITPFALAPTVVPAVPQVAVEPKAEAAPVAEAAAADSGVISVKKREAVSDPLFYADTIGRYPGVINAAWKVGTPVAVPTSYTVSEPVVKSVVPAAPVVKSVVPTTTLFFGL